MADGLSSTVANAWLGTLVNTATSWATCYVDLHLTGPGPAGTISTSVGSRPSS